jgi:hypothetical protein
VMLSIAENRCWNWNNYFFLQSRVLSANHIIQIFILVFMLFLPINQDIYNLQSTSPVSSSAHICSQSAKPITNKHPTLKMIWKMQNLSPLSMPTQ